MGVVVQPSGERKGVIVADLGVVQIESLEIDVVVQGVAEPDGALMTQVLHVLHSDAAGDVASIDFRLAAVTCPGRMRSEDAREQQPPQAMRHAVARRWR